MSTKISTKRFQKGFQFFLFFCSWKARISEFWPYELTLTIDFKIITPHPVSNESQMSILSNLNDSDDNWFWSTWNIKLKLKFENTLFWSKFG